MRKGLVIVGLLSAGLIIGGTVWHFRSKNPKKSTDDNDSKSNEDIPDTTKPSSQTNVNATESEPHKQQASTSSGGGSVATSSSSVLDNLLKKLGSGARLKNNQVFAPFNSNKHLAIFYSNGRFSVFKIGEEKKGYLAKGAFKNDGLTLIPDGKKQISSSSVWTNLNSLPIKK